MLIIGAGVLGLQVASKSIEDLKEEIVIVDPPLSSASQVSGGMLRVFHQDISNVELALASLKILKKDANFCNRGALSILPKSMLDYAKTVQTFLDTKEYPTQLLTPKSLAEEFGIKVDEGSLGFYEREAGSIRVPAFLNGLKESLRRHSQVSFIQEKVLNIEILPRVGMRVHFLGGQHRDFSKVVIAAGAGSSHLLKTTGIETPSLHRVLAFRASGGSHQNSPNLFSYTDHFFCGAAWGCHLATRIGAIRRMATHQSAVF